MLIYRREEKLGSTGFNSTKCLEWNKYSNTVILGTIWEVAIDHKRTALHSRSAKIYNPKTILAAASNGCCCRYRNYGTNFAAVADTPSTAFCIVILGPEDKRIGCFILKEFSISAIQKVCW